MANFDREREDFVEAVLGRPPSNLAERFEEARKLVKLCEDAGLGTSCEGEVEDLFLIAAIGMYMERGEGQKYSRNPIGLVARLRQWAKWLDGETKDWQASDFSPESQPILENKTMAIARHIGRMLYVTEGFILLTFHLGVKEAPGYSAFVSSVSRREQIKLLADYLKNLKAGQAKQS